jgi:peptidoglycan hydrolase-like protein with peptidoglycan-binding domain
MACLAARRPDAARTEAPARTLNRRLQEEEAMRPMLAVAAALVVAGAAGSAEAQERQALLIGNAAYANAPGAQTAVRDVRAVAEALRQAGWEVSVSTDLDRAGMRAALTRFAASAGDAADILVYYSGHALHTGGRTYLAPVDQETGSLVEVLFGGVPLELVLRLAEMAPGDGVVLIDGAQLEGFEPTPFVEPGLTAIEPPEGVVVISAAPPGQAIRRAPERDSRFAQAIVERMLAPGAELMATVQEIGSPVWVAGDPEAEIVLAPPPEPSAPPEPPELSEPSAPPEQGTLEEEIELAYWRAAERSGEAEDFQAYLARYPDGVFAGFARDRLEEMGSRAGQPGVGPGVEPGGDPASAAERSLNLSDTRIRQVQQWLRATGHEPGSVDGVMGPRTRQALRDWQRAEGFEVSGYLDRAQLDRLAGEGEAALVEQRRREEERRRVAAAEDESYWAATGAGATAEGYRDYLGRYPQGLHAAEARAALDAIGASAPEDELARERRRFEQARRADTAEGYRDYLAAYPQGLWRNEALARLDEIEGAGPQTSQQPGLEQAEHALALNAKDRQSVEQRLRSLGFEPGPLDGTLDARTRAAIQGYQASRGMESTGYLDRRTVVGIVQETNQAQGGTLIIDGTDVVRELIESLERTQ